VGTESSAAAGPTGADPLAAGATGIRPEGQAAPFIDSAASSTNPAGGEAWSDSGSAGSGDGGDDPDPGWFSPQSGAGQYTGPVPERLSAERPADGPIPPPAAETGPRSDAPSAAAGAATSDQEAGAGSPAARADGLEAAPDPALPVDLGGVPSGVASPDMGWPPDSRDLRSPEPTETAMVHVDPDPEIGSPPPSVGWMEEPAARLDPDDGPQSPGEGDDSAAGLEGAELDHSPGAGAPGEAVELDEAREAAGAPEIAGDDGAVAQRVAGVGPGATPGSDLGTSAAPAPDEVPWNEPALPMAWPPGMTPPDRGERSGSLREDSDEDDLVAEPDPAWPKLWQSAEPREGGGPDEIAGGVHAATSVDRASVKRDADAPSEVHSTDDAPSPDQRPPVVDITTQASGGGPGSAESPEPDHGHSVGTDVQPGDRTFAGDEGGIDGGGHANIATAVQQAKPEEGEVELREPPADPRRVDVSRETSAGGGGGMDPEPENEDLEDEAAVAVREAVSRAAAEAGVDVSRETEVAATDISIDELGGESSIDREAAARSARVTFRIDRDALNGDRRVVAVANQKGGVGKSTTAVNIGAYLALAGARVLVVDLDPQGNASTGLGLDHREIEPSIYDVLTGEASPTAAIRPTGVANLHVLPSTIDLAGAEVELVSTMSRETRLRRALESVDHQYDSILIDCPPSLGLLTVNALAAADELLIPIQCEYYALEGLGQLLRNVELVRANLNPDLRIGGIVLTMYDGRTRLALQVVDEVRKHFTDIVYQTVVPRSVRLSEAPGYGLPIALYDPLSRGGIAYRDLTFELAERSGLLAPTGEGAS
jgi:chromosome partitioning protein